MARHRLPGTPEGTRAGSSYRRALGTASLGAIVLLCACFAIAIGDETASLTVANRTAHVVTVVVANKTFPAVTPGSEVTYRSSGTSNSTVSAKVSYAEGQGVEGTVQRSFLLVASTPGTTYGTGVYWACQVGGPIAAPVRPAPVYWSVTPDTLAAH